MTGYVETCEIMNDCVDVVQEVARDLRGLHGLLTALANDADCGGNVCVHADAIDLAAQQALMMHRALSVAAEYVAASIDGGE